MTVSDIFRWLILLSSSITFGLLIVYAKANTSRWLYAVPGLLVMANLMLFSAARILAGHDLTPFWIMVFNNWSNIIQLQVIFTTAFITCRYITTRYLWKSQ